MGPHTAECSGGSSQDEEGRYLSGQTGEQGQLPEPWTVRLVLLELDADLQGLA